MLTSAAGREAVAHVQIACEVSERQACSALGADRISVRYRSRRSDDAAARARLCEPVSVRRRLGYLLAKKSRSTVNCPILAWSFSTSSS
jgi:putative transposase